MQLSIVRHSASPSVCVKRDDVISLQSVGRYVAFARREIDDPASTGCANPKIHLGWSAPGVDQLDDNHVSASYLHWTLRIEWRLISGNVSLPTLESNSSIVVDIAEPKSKNRPDRNSADMKVIKVLVPSVGCSRYQPRRYVAQVAVQFFRDGCHYTRGYLATRSIIGHHLSPLFDAPSAVFLT